jgi:hypothetical protein
VCFTGADGGPVSSECQCYDRDADGDVDLSDYVEWAAALTGPG